MRAGLGAPEKGGNPEARGVKPQLHVGFCTAPRPRVKHAKREKERRKIERKTERVRPSREIQESNFGEDIGKPCFWPQAQKTVKEYPQLFEEKSNKPLATRKSKIKRRRARNTERLRLYRVYMNFDFCERIAWSSWMHPRSFFEALIPIRAPEGPENQISFSELLSRQPIQLNIPRQVSHHLRRLSCTS